MRFAGRVGRLQAGCGSNTGFLGSMNTQHTAPITNRPASNQNGAFQLPNNLTE